MNKNSFLCANLYFYVLLQKYFFNPNVFLFYFTYLIIFLYIYKYNILINNSQQSFS